MATPMSGAHTPPNEMSSGATVFQRTHTIFARRQALSLTESPRNLRQAVTGEYAAASFSSST